MTQSDVSFMYLQGNLYRLSALSLVVFFFITCCFIMVSVHKLIMPLNFLDVLLYIGCMAWLMYIIWAKCWKLHILVVHFFLHIEFLLTS
jgi:hypothetical protein